MKTKTEEFNLSKKRQKELRIYLITKIGLSIKDTNAILNAIEIQDKEFIRRLKEYCRSSSDLPNTRIDEIKVFDCVLREIDKFAGDKLK